MSILMLSGIDARTKDTIRAAKPDVVFIAWHGAVGEDGRIQALLEELGIPYVGSDPASSHACFQKDITKKRLIADGIATPEYVVVEAGYRPSLIDGIRFPVVIKPPDSGASRGLEKVDDRPTFDRRVRRALADGRRLLVEEFIQGDEFTVGVIERDGEVIALPVRACPPGLYTFALKYRNPDSSGAWVDEPALRELARRVFVLMGCRDLARIDMIRREGMPYVLEINTIPGLTEYEWFCLSAKRHGISAVDLYEGFLLQALRRAESSDDSCG